MVLDAIPADDRRHGQPGKPAQIIRRRRPQPGAVAQVQLDDAGAEGGKPDQLTLGTPEKG